MKLFRQKHGLELLMLRTEAHNCYATMLRLIPSFTSAISHTYLIAVVEVGLLVNKLLITLGPDV